MTDRWKLSLFRNMEVGRTIVEVGAGAGCNFIYYPAGCKVTCIEPLEDFQQHLERHKLR